MRTRTIVPALLLACASTAPALAERGPWLHVQVEGADGEPKLNVNVPLVMARLAAGALDDQIAEHVRIETDGLDRDDDLSIAEIKTMWRELRQIDHGQLFSAKDEDEQVIVERRGGNVVVRITDREGRRPQRVHVEIPATVIDALLAPTGDQIDLPGALSQLDGSFRGDLVRVEDGDSRVHIWVD